MPVLCATGERNERFTEAVHAATTGVIGEVAVRAGADFVEIESLAAALKPDLLIGSSKAHSLARRLDIPLVRVGFPVHDRLGGARILHLGYDGAQQLFDRIANELLADRQRRSPVGYSYM